MKMIEGSGGQQRIKQPKPYIPIVRDDDPKLRSVAFAKMQLLLCEGPIQGPPDGDLERATYLDETPLQGSTGRKFIEVEDLVLARGTLQQSSVPDYEGVASTIVVGRDVTKDRPISQAVVGGDDGGYRARIILDFIGLQRTRQNGDKEGNGDVLGADVDYNIEAFDQNGISVYRQRYKVNGKFGGPFQRSHEFDLPGAGPWTIRVERDTQDDDTRGVNDLFISAFSFGSITLLYRATFRYPGSACLSVGINAETYNQLPRIDVDLKGINDIQVPTNYDPVNRTYAGNWDGTFKQAYTDNPVWIFYDMLTRSRFGVGDYIDAANIDKWELYQISKYCDEQVPRPGGGTEPRFTCNLILQSAEEAWTVLNQLASIFRALIFYAGSTVTATQDRPGSFVYTFTEANTVCDVDEDGNVTSANFTYTSTARKARHTAVITSWDDPGNRYQPRTEIIIDDEGISKYGYRELDLRLLGVTSRGQALRAGKWALVTEKLRDDSVSFRCGPVGGALRPGDLIYVADPMKAADRYGGRFTDVQANGRVTVDDLPAALRAGPLVAGTTLIFSTSATVTQPVAREVPVTREVPITSIINAADGIIQCDFSGVPAGNPTLPERGWPWLINSPSRKLQQFRIVGIEEQERNVFAITALRYNASLYGNVDFDTPLDTDEDYFFTIKELLKPTITRARLDYKNGEIRIDAAWRASNAPELYPEIDPTIAFYRFQWQDGTTQPDGTVIWSEAWKPIPDQFDNAEFISIPQFFCGIRYRIRIRGVSFIGRESDWVQAEVEGFESQYAVKTDQINLDWQCNSDGSHLISVRVDGSLPVFASQMQWQIRPFTTAATAVFEGQTVMNAHMQHNVAATLAANDWIDFAETATTNSYSLFVPSLEPEIIAWEARVKYLGAEVCWESEWSNGVSIPRGAIAPPAPIELRMVLEGGSQSRLGERRFSWTTLNVPPFAERWPLGVVTDIESYQVRYKQGTSPDWEQAIDLFSDGIPANTTWFETHLFDSGNWIVMMRAKDATGFLSDDLAVLFVGVGDVLPSNVILRDDLRDQGFPGSIANCNRAAVTVAPLMYPEPTQDPIYYEPVQDQFYEGTTGSKLVQDDPTQEMSYEFLLGNEFEGRSNLIIYTEATGTYRWFVSRIPVNDELMYPEPLTERFYTGSKDPTPPTPPLPTPPTPPLPTPPLPTSYSVNISPSGTVNEGQNVFVVFTTDNAPAGEKYFYTVSGGQITSADLSGLPLNGPLSIATTGQAAISFTVAEDTLTELTEQAVIELRLGSVNGSILASDTLVINDTSVEPPPPGVPSYTLVLAPTELNEGTTIVATVNVINVASGTTLYYGIGGVSANDISIPLTGTMITTAGNSAVLNIPVIADNLTEGNEIIRVNIFDTASATIAVATGLATIVDTSTTPGVAVPSYALSINPPLVNEGDDVTITVNTTNVADGTLLFWTISGITSSDFTGGQSQGALTITNNTGVLILNVAADSLTEGNETATVSLRTGSTSGPVVQTAAFTIADTSIGAPLIPSYSLNASPNPVNEGASTTLLFTTANIPNGTQFEWFISGNNITNSDFVGGALSGFFTVNNNSASVTVTLAADVITEGAESFLFRVFSTSTALMYPIPTTDPLYTSPTTGSFYANAAGVFVIQTTVAINDTSTGGGGGGPGPGPTGNPLVDQAGNVFVTEASDRITVG